jgi:hypothetical protein
MAMRCAERSGTCTMLWQHEFYMVNEPRHGAYLYQALEFKVGSNLPLDEVAGWTPKLLTRNRLLLKIYKKKVRQGQNKKKQKEIKQKENKNKNKKKLNQ